jgi:acyl-CoA synthetase (AMP-forming)/AMP-acid ligase II
VSNRPRLKQCYEHSVIAAYAFGIQHEWGAELVASIASRCRLQEGELRQSLRPCLPAPMIPSRMVIVESIPINENGKVAVQRLLKS